MNPEESSSSRTLSDWKRGVRSALAAPLSLSRGPAVNNLRGDLAGGTTAAVVAFPNAIAFGSIVMAPLGAEFIPLGIIGGLVALSFTNLFSAPLGSARYMISSPNSLT